MPSGGPEDGHGPLRILHVFRAPLGGLFRHVVDAARGQAARGHKVGIFCDSSTGGKRGDEALEALRPELALGVHRIAMRRNPSLHDAAAMAALTRLYYRLKPNVLHGHGSKGGAYARLMTAPGLDRRTIRAYTPHGGSFNYNPGSLAHTFYMRAEGLLGLRTDAFLFESHYVRERFEAYVGRTSKLVRVIHNGIAESEFEPLDRIEDPFDLVYIGELRSAKGVDTLIDAVAVLRREHGMRLTLLAVGSGPSEAELHDRAKAAGIWDTTVFVPPQPIRHALSRARLMVIPSKAESLPYVILEAAAAAQPLVSTNVGGIREIFGPWAGELIPPGDPVRMAEAIKAKLAEPEEVREGKARQLSGHVRGAFRIDAMVDQGIQGYREAFAARGRRPR